MWKYIGIYSCFRRSGAVRLPRSWVRIPPGAWMFVCCECCVLSGRGLCDGLITRPEESYRLWCVVVCDIETSRMRRPWPALGRSATGEKKYSCFFWDTNLGHQSTAALKLRYSSSRILVIIFSCRHHKKIPSLYSMNYHLAVFSYNRIYDPLLQYNSTLFYIYQFYRCLCKQWMPKRNLFIYY